MIRKMINERFVICFNLLIASILFQSCKNTEGHNEKNGSIVSRMTKDRVSSDNGGFDKLDTNGIIALIKMNPAIAKNSDIEIQRVFIRGNEIKYLLVGVGSGTCARSYLLMFEKKEIKKCAELEKNCDSDLFMASYQYKEFTEESDTVFDINIITQKVIDTSLIEKSGHLKNGASLDDVGSKNDTVFKQVSLAFLNSSKVPNWPAIWK